MVVSIKAFVFPMPLSAEEAIFLPLEESFSESKAAVTKAQENLDEWTARLARCYDRRNPSTDSFGEIKEEIFWLAKQVDKAREELAKREKCFAKSREDLVNSRKELARREVLTCIIRTQ
jgi:hypothetical protein